MSRPIMRAFSSSGVHGLRVECSPSLRVVLDDFATAACLAFSYRTEVGQDWLGGSVSPVVPIPLLEDDAGGY